MTTPTGTIPPPLVARVDMINGMFPLPDETKIAMSEIRGIMAEAAEKVAKVFGSGVKHDTGRAIATIDLIQQTKIVACDALILPHHVPQNK